MIAYISAFRIRLIRGLQYRVAALAGVGTQFFWGFMLIMVFQAFASNSRESSPMSLSQIASYVWLQQAFLAFVMLWFRDAELFALIVSGDVAYEFTRPVDLYGFWYARLLAGRLASAALRCLPILIVAALLPAPFTLLPPTCPASLLLFVTTLFLGLLVLVAISMFVYILTFATKSPMASFLVVGPVGEFCAGMIVPIPMMPDAVRRVVMVLPFRLATDLPFRTYSGSIGSVEALEGIVLQLLWLAVLVAVGRAALARAAVHASILGG
jgi:ABC-2 type transport system permease protein